MDTQTNNLRNVRVFNNAADPAAFLAQFKTFTDSTQTALAGNTAALEAQAKEVKAISEEVDRLSLLASARGLSEGGSGGLSPRTSDATAAGRREFDALAAGLRARDVAAIRNAMSVASDPDGGFLVFPTISSVMTRRLFDVSPLASMVRSITLDSGDAFEEPVDIGEPEAVWVGESDARPKTSTPKLGLLSIPLQEIYALQPLTQKLIDTSQFDLGAWIANKISDKFARTIGASLIGGNGISKPMGFLSGAFSTAGDFDRAWGTVQYVPTGAAGAFTLSGPGDVLRDITFKLRQPYRAGASWLMNSNVMSRIDQLKDSTGQYLLRPSMTAGAPAELLGYPVAIDEQMPDIAANSLSIAFGNFKLGYTLVQRPGLKTLIDPYSDKPNVQFYAYQRIGGSINNSEAIKVVKFSAT